MTLRQKIGFGWKIINQLIYKGIYDEIKLQEWTTRIFTTQIEKEGRANDFWKKLNSAIEIGKQILYKRIELERGKERCSNCEVLRGDSPIYTKWSCNRVLLDSTAGEICAEFYCDECGSCVFITLGFRTKTYTT